MKVLPELLRAALSAVLLSGIAGYAETLYTVTDIGGLGSDNGSKALAINDRGQITGIGALAEPDSTGAGVHAFLYDRGTMSDLGTLGRNSFGLAINNQGQVAGHSEGPVSGFLVSRAFLYSAGVMHDIGTLGGYGAQAYAINSKGQITGWSSLSEFSGQHAFLYSDGVMHDLPVGTFSIGYGINGSGQIVGTSDAVAAGGFLYSQGVLIPLGTLGGLFSVPFAINERGQVTGGASADPTPDNPFGVEHPFVYDNGVMRDIGGGHVFIGWGNAINDHGDVVGVANASSTSEFHGFVYRDGTLADLNTLLDPTTGAGWVILEATGIDNRGEIVGTASPVGDPAQAHAVLLRPCRTGDDHDASGPPQTASSPPRCGSAAAIGGP